MESTSNGETLKEMSNWMRDLPEKAKAKPLSQLCLPGSHDSFTYSLERGSGAGKGSTTDNNAEGICSVPKSPV